MWDGIQGMRVGTMSRPVDCYWDKGGEHSCLGLIGSISMKSAETSSAFSTYLFKDPSLICAFDRQRIINVQTVASNPS